MGLAKKVARWLRTSGFPLEMEVARSLEKAGLEVRKGDEVDLVAVYAAAWETHREISGAEVRFSIECDNGEPWVVFAKDHAAPRTPANTYCNEPAANLISHLDLAEMLRPGGFLLGPEYSGYGVKTAFREKGGRDPAQASCKALGRSVFQSGELNVLEEVDKVVLPGHRGKIALRVPLVVLGGPLFEAREEGESDVIVREISFGRIHWTGERGTTSLIDVVTRDSLKRYLKSVRRDLDAIRGLFEEDPALVEQAYSSMLSEIAEVFIHRPEDG